jgi:hypothetical protein
MTTANTSSRLETSCAEISTISAASGSGGSATESSTAAPDSEDLGRSGYVGEAEEKESLGEEWERKLRLVWLEKESVGDEHCFGQILQWDARDEHNERVIEAILRTPLALSLSLSLSQSSPFFTPCPALELGLSYPFPFQ